MVSPSSSCKRLFDRTGVSFLWNEVARSPPWLQRRLCSGPTLQLLYTQDNIFWLVISLMQMREEPIKLHKTLILLLSHGKPTDKFSCYKRERDIFLNFCLAKTDGKKEDCEEVVWWAICLRFDVISLCQEHVRANAGHPASITSCVSTAW